MWCNPTGGRWLNLDVKTVLCGAAASVIARLLAALEMIDRPSKHSASVPPSDGFPPFAFVGRERPLRAVPKVLFRPWISDVV